VRVDGSEAGYCDLTMAATRFLESQLLLPMSQVLKIAAERPKRGLPDAPMDKTRQLLHPVGLRQASLVFIVPLFEIVFAAA
jgi:hypothetical protein